VRVSTMFSSFYQQVNIVFNKDDIHTLINIIIIDPTCANFLHRSCTIQGFTTSNVTQTKQKNYHNQHLIDQFLPLAIEVFGCLHKQVDVYLQDCVNAFWSSKGPEGLFLSILVVFLYQNIFNYVTKDANILHLKLGNSGRLSYFPSSTPSGDTPHCHDWPIIGSWLLKWKHFDINLC